MRKWHSSLLYIHETYANIATGQLVELLLMIIRGKKFQFRSSCKAGGNVGLIGKHYRLPTATCEVDLFIYLSHVCTVVQRNVR